MKSSKVDWFSKTKKGLRKPVTSIGVGLLAVILILPTVIVPLKYQADEDVDSFRVKRSGFKDITKEDEVEEDTSIVDISNKVFANISNGNYTKGNTQDKKVNDPKANSPMDSGSNKNNNNNSNNSTGKIKRGSDGLPIVVSSDKAPLSKIDEMKKKGSGGNPVKIKLEGYNPNTAILYSVGSSRTVLIDAGHQQDTTTVDDMLSGTTSSDTGTPEYKITLQYAKEACIQFLEAGYNVIMSRTVNDASISNNARGELASKAKCDLFIAIHTDGIDSMAHGYTPVLKNSSSPAKPYSDKFRSKLTQKNTGIVTTRPTQYKDLGIFNKCGNVPSILLEVGFIQPKNADGPLVESEGYRKKFCEAMVEAAKEFIPLK